MAFCKIALYKQPILTKEKNFIIEDYSNYLSTLTKVIVDHVQYIKPQLEQTIKIANLENSFNMQQQLGYQATSSFYSYFNYMVVLYYEVDDLGQETGTSQRSGFYFINSWNWISYNTAEISITMDVLNTIGVPSATNKYCNWDAKTLIHRTHKNRYAIASSVRYWNVDPVAEEINPILFAGDGVKIPDSEGTAKNWYLIYKNSLDNAEDTNNVVDCLLTTNKTTKVAYTGSSKSISYQDLTEGVWNYLLPALAPGEQVVEFTDELSGSLITILTSGSGNNHHNAVVEYVRTGSIIKIYVYDYNDLSEQLTLDASYIATDIQVLADISEYHYSAGRLATYPSMTAASSQAFESGTVVKTLNQIGSLNRTDSKIIKVIELPYNPDTAAIAYDSVNYRYTLNGSVWKYDSETGFLKLINLNREFKGSISFASNYAPEYIKFVNPLSSLSIDTSALKSKNYEPKLWHSEFYQRKYVYDSFAKVIPLEKTSPGTISFGIDFYPTSTINSRFLFDFKDARWGDKKTDFDRYLYSARNNELTLYNSAYINYIRNGYNFDIKNRNRQNAFNIVSGAATIAAGIASGGVGAAVIGSSLLGGINTAIQQQNSLDKSLAQLQAQSVNVYGADDVDLLNVYCENKLRLFTYEVSDHMKDILFDLFYYTGYKEGKQGTPNTTSRYWFNFIQCDPVLKNMILDLPEGVWDAYKDKWKEGTTVFHKRSSSWNLEQTKENWENDLV